MVSRVLKPLKFCCIKFSCRYSELLTINLPFFILNDDSYLSFNTLFFSYSIFLFDFQYFLLPDCFMLTGFERGDVGAVDCRFIHFDLF